MARKRGNGEGSITRRKDGLYMARYTVQTATGTKRKTLYGKTRGEVSEKLTKAMADRDGGLAFEGEDQLLGEYLDRWLNGTVKGSVKPSTFEGYERMVRNHIKPELGHSKLKILIPDHVQYFYQRKLDTGLAPGTVRLMHGILHKALEQAVKWGTIPRNVCKAVTPPKPNPEEIRPLDAEDAKRFLHAANGDRLEASTYSPSRRGCVWASFWVSNGKTWTKRPMSFGSGGPSPRRGPARSAQRPRTVRVAA